MIPKLTRAFSLTVLTILFSTFVLAGPVPILPGKDGFHTTPGTLFNPNPLLPGGFPAGFFGLKGGVPSDAIPGPLPILSVGPGPDLVPVTIVTTFLTGPGCHTGSVNIHCYLQTVTLTELVDTVVMRSGGTLNGTLPLDIMLVHLSLQSLSPIPVTYGGTNPSLFNIIIGLDGAQPTGILNLTQVTNTTGTMDTVLPVNYKVSFVGTNPADPLVNNINGLQEVLQSRGNSFQIIPEPGAAATVLLGGLAILLWSRRRSRSRK